MRIGTSAALLIAALGLAGPNAQAALVISTNATNNMSCTKGQCTATAASAVLNVGAITNTLSVTSFTVSTGSAAQNIVIDTSVSWTSANTLTLNAQRSIVVNASVSDAGSGGLALNMGSNGQLSFGANGNIGFLGTSNAFTIDSITYTLVNSVQSLASAFSGCLNCKVALASNYDAKPDGTWSVAPVSQITSPGVFEGLGNTITNLSVNDGSPGDTVGLVGLLSGGTVENLHLTRAKVQATGSPNALSAVGGLVGSNQGTLFGDSVGGRVTAGYAYAGGLAGGQGFASTSNSSAAVAVTLTGAGYAGGLLGYDINSASVANSHATGNVTGGDGMSVGGLIGENAEPVDNSWASGAVSGGGNAHVGGLIGLEFGGTISRSYATGPASVGASSGGQNTDAGGLVGELDGTVTQSWATGAVSGLDGATAGGLVGGNFGAIDNSYAKGAITSGGSTGGLAGYNGSSSTISAAYSIGAPQGASGATGGLIGGDSAPAGSVKHTYWDTTTSGITSSSQGAGFPASDPGIAPKTTSQLRAGLPKGFSSSIWGQKSTVNNGLPYLLAVPPG